VGANGAVTTGDVSPARTGDGSLGMASLDYKAQEDARRFTWEQGDARLRITARAPLDLDRQTNGDVMLVTTLRVDALPGRNAWVAMGCGQGCEGRVALGPQLSRLAPGQWVRVGVPLKCFRVAGADMHRIDRPFVWDAGKGSQLAVFSVALGSDAEQVIDCAR
jgi:beta-glucosidase